MSILHLPHVLATSLNNIFCNIPQKYFWPYPSKYLDAGRRPSNWWALHRQKPMQLKMRWTSSSSKLTTGSPKLTSLQSWPLTKVDLLPLQVTERLGERLQNINLWKFELEKVFKLVLILKRQFFNDLGSQTTRDITAEIELLMVEKRRLEYGIQVIWQSWYSLSFWKSRKIWDVLFWISYHFNLVETNIQMSTIPIIIYIITRLPRAPSTSQGIALATVNEGSITILFRSSAAKNIFFYVL